MVSALQTGFAFWFVRMDSSAGFYLMAIVLGLGYSGVMTSFSICVREMTPARPRGISTGIVFLFAWIGMGLGGYQGGFFYDLTGDYTLSFANAALAGVVNLVIVGALLAYFTRQRVGRMALQAA